MKLSLIFPAYNEAESIAGVLERFSQYCLARNIDHEIIVVDDGSGDATAAKVKDFADRHTSVRLVEHSTNQGYGAALRSGFAAATGDYIFFTDSDGQFRPDDLDQTLKLVDANAIVLGYRKHRAEGVVRRLNAWLWTRGIALLLGLHVRDLNCAWKLFPQTLLSSATLVSHGAFINAELLNYARQKNLSFREMPVSHWQRQFGSATGANVRVIFHAFRGLASFLRSHRRLAAKNISLPARPSPVWPRESNN